ncbi:MAG TPA: YihY/virulence factor BrkB family protein [Cytophagaceae bacterium]|jgi:membrane protein
MENSSRFSIYDIPFLFKETLKKWISHNPLDLSAVVSYFAIFSLPGLLIIIIAVASIGFGEAEAEGRVAERISSFIGLNTGQQIERLILEVNSRGESMVSSFFGISFLIFIASGVFTAVQRALDVIIELPPEKVRKGFRATLANRLLSVGMILAIGFCLLLSLIFTSFSSFMVERMEANFNHSLGRLFYFSNFLFSFIVVTMMFTLIYKYLPSVKTNWECVLVSAPPAALLFLIGKYGLNLFLDHADPVSPYGVAGYVILIIIWITYSSMILLLGAEFMYVYRKKYFS